MAGLNNLISNTSQQQTTMPTWFDSAQQNVVNQATAAANAAPTPQNTVAQGAVNALSGPTNAFSTATNTLQNIASGAANPWITNPTTGQVTPDTSTPMGGLFQAQDQQLQQLMPNYTAAPAAGAIGAGNFGSLRGQTSVNKAMGDAQASLTAQQMQAALQNQATGVNAASAAGNTAQQGINNQLTVGQYQQAAPFTNVSNYGKVVSGIQAPETVSNQTQLSPLNQIAGLGALGSGALTQLFGTAGTGTVSGTSGLIGSGGVSSAFNSLMKSLGLTSTSNPYAGNANGTAITGTGSTGDVSASSPTLADGSPNPNYDVYADPNATQAQIDAANQSALSNFTPSGGTTTAKAGGSVRIDGTIGNTGSINSGY